jgi:DNA replication protein DnaC
MERAFPEAAVTGYEPLVDAMNNADEDRHVAAAGADALLRKLRQSRLDNSRDALMAELIAIDLLIVDDFPLEPMTREESRDVYQLFVERTGRAASVVTSNRDTAE